MDLTPEAMFAIYVEHGKQALVDRICIFENDMPEVNKTLHGIIDITVMGYEGVISIDEFQRQMHDLNDQLFEQLGDAALDALNEGNLDQNEAEEYFEILNSKKDSCDKREQKLQ